MPADARSPESLSPQLRIIQSAVTIIARRGAGNMSISEICEEAGVSRATFYRHFPDRAALYSGIYDQGTAHFARRLRDRIAKKPEPESRIRLLAEFLAEELKNSRLQKLFRADEHFMQGLTGAVMAHGAELFEDIMAPVFDMADVVRGTPLNRGRIAQAVTRLHTCMLIIEEPQNFQDIADSLEWAMRSFLVGPPA